MRSVARRRSGWWLAAGAIAVIASGCMPPPRIVLGGVGPGPAGPIALPAGLYHIDWAAHDAGATDHGCLIGLAIERSDPPPDRAAKDPFRGAWLPKLVYRSLARGEAIVGRYPGLVLDAGSYLLRAEGSCAWQAEIGAGSDGEQPGPPRMINDGTLEQG